jgi:hypothetical protein
MSQNNAVLRRGFSTLTCVKTLVRNRVTAERLDAEESIPEFNTVIERFARPKIRLAQFCKMM